MPIPDSKRRWFRSRRIGSSSDCLLAIVPALAVGTISVVRLQSPQGLDGVDRRGGSWDGGPRMLLWWVASLIFRWRFQFGIRSVLAFCLACSIAVVGWRWKCSRLDGKRRWLRR